MRQYSAEVIWSRADQDFLDGRYSRGNRWRFDGGVEVPGSASPHIVPVPLADPGTVAFSGAHLPTREQIDAIHREAHEECFIANSVRTEMRCEPA